MCALVRVPNWCVCVSLCVRELSFVKFCCGRQIFRCRCLFGKSRENFAAGFWGCLIGPGDRTGYGRINLHDRVSGLDAGQSEHIFRTKLIGPD